MTDDNDRVGYLDIDKLLECRALDKLALWTKPRHAQRKAYLLTERPILLEVTQMLTDLVKHSGSGSSVEISELSISALISERFLRRMRKTNTRAKLRVRQWMQEYDTTKHVELAIQNL
jgi:hypothetical protein